MTNPVITTDSQFFIYDKNNKVFFPVPSNVPTVPNPRKRRLSIFESIAPSPPKSYSDTVMGL